MSDSVVAGIYIERNGALLVRAKKQRNVPFPTLDLLNDYEEVNWSPENVEEAKHYLHELAEVLAKSGPELCSIGVGSYGPFHSLMRTNPNFSVVHSERADLPLRGVNLRKIFSDHLVQSGARIRPLLTVHTDANACALGEAMARDLPKHHVLVYLLVTDGIGAGIVTGRTVYRSALHPEVGMLHVRYASDDKLKPSKFSNEYLGSLSYFADNRALLQRYRLKSGGHSVTQEMLLKIGNDRFWDLRAYYLAQACVAITTLLAPHRIVIQADIDPRGDLVDLTRQKFYHFLRERSNEGAPAYELSGGIDSGVVAYHVAATARPIESFGFNVRYPYAEFRREKLFVEAIASELGVQIIEVNGAEYGEFDAVLSPIPFSEPNPLGSFRSYYDFLLKAALNKNCRVILTGAGGDLVFSTSSRSQFEVPNLWTSDKYNRMFKRTLADAVRDNIVAIVQDANQKNAAVRYKLLDNPIGHHYFRRFGIKFISGFATPGILEASDTERRKMSLDELRREKEMARRIYRQRLPDIVLDREGKVNHIGLERRSIINRRNEILELIRKSERVLELIGLNVVEMEGILADIQRGATFEDRIFGSVIHLLSWHRDFQSAIEGFART